MTAIAGRSSRSSSASPGSAEPWCATLRISTCRDSRRRGHLRLGVAGQERVGLAVAREEHDESRFGSSEARRARAAREHAEPQAAQPERLPRPRLEDVDAAIAAAVRSASQLLRARDGQPRIEHTGDVEPLSTSAVPPTWSRCGCVSTIADSRRTPSLRSCPATSASGGP